MTPRVDRVNRVLLVVVGTILILLGIAVLLHSTGILGDDRADSPVIATATADWYAANGSWLWPTLAAVAFVLLVLAIWWVAAQVRTQGSSRVEIERAPTGTVTVSGGYLEECVERDAVQLDGIARARARISTDPEAIHLDLTLWVGPPYDVGAAVARVANTVLPHLAVTLDTDEPRPIHTRIHVETAEAAISRLR